MGLATRIVKYLLLIFTLIFFLAGMAALGIGIWMLQTSSDSIVRVASSINDDNVNSGTDAVKNLNQSGDSVIRTCAIMLICGGCFVFVVTILGCVAAWREYRLVLLFYAICLMLVLALMIAAGIYAAVWSGTVESKFRSSLYRAVHKFYQGDERNSTTNLPRPGINFFTTSINALMIRFSCCGFNSYQDFYPGNATTSFNLTNNYVNAENNTFHVAGQVPIYCCVLQKPVVRSQPLPLVRDCQTNPVPDGSIHRNGCYKPVVGWIKGNMAWFIGIGIGVGILQIFGIVLALWLCIVIGKDDYDDD